MNQAGRWFALLTGKLIRRGVHTSLKALEQDIKDWDHHLERQPQAFTWTRTAGEILSSLAGYLTKIGAGDRINTQD